MSILEFTELPLLQEARRIAVFAPNWVGDAVMSLGLLQALKQNHAYIAVVCTPTTASVYRHSSVVDEVIEVPLQSGGVQWRLRRQCSQNLRKRSLPFTHAYILPNSFKSALIPFWAKIPQRIGYASEGRGFLLTHCLAKPSKKNKPPMLDWYGQLAGIHQGLVPRPHLLGAVDAFNVNVGIFSELKSKKFLAVAPGAEYGPAKRWPVQYFAATLQAYLEFDQTRSVCLLGGPKDIAVCQAVLEFLPQALRIRVYPLAGKTSLDQAIVLIAQSEALLTNDSGLMHVAAALQVPLQAIYGSSDPRHTPPLSDQAQVHWLHLDCSPCFKRECPLGHTRCLVSLTPERVISALNDQLKMTVEL